MHNGSELQQEFLLLAESEGHQLTGTELGLDRALSVARSLAMGGWRVRVQPCDPYLEDPIHYEIWSVAETPFPVEAAA